MKSNCSSDNLEEKDDDSEEEMGNNSQSSDARNVHNTDISNSKSGKFNTNTALNIFRITNVILHFFFIFSMSATFQFVLFYCTLQ